MQTKGQMCSGGSIKIVAVLLVVSMSTTVFGQPRADKAPTTNPKLKLIKIETLDQPAVWPKGLGDMAKGLDVIPQGVPIPTYEMHVDNTTGGVASAGTASAWVFLDDHDSAFFQPIKSSDEGSFIANQRFFANGWVPGDSLSGYSMLVFNSWDNSGTAVMVTSLWDGDPLNLADTVCTVDGTSAPIPGTMATFPDIPQGSLLNAVVTFDKIPYVCDRIWQVYTLDAGCRLGWRMGGENLSLEYLGPQIGFSDVVELLYDSGDNPGFCCNDETTMCDHDDAATCQGGTNAGALCPNGDVDCNGSPCSTNECAQHATFCTTGVADTVSLFSFSDAIDEASYFASLVGSVSAATDTTISMVDQATGSSSITLSSVPVGGVGVLVDFMLSDFDPGDTGLGIKSFQAKVDPAGFSSGVGAPLTPWAPDCSLNGDADCLAAFGNLGTGGAAAGCGTIASATECSPSFIQNREDYFFCDNRFPPCGQAESIVELQACRETQLNCGAVIKNTAFARTTHKPHYLMTVAIFVPGDARGTYTVAPSLNPGSNSVLDEFNQFLTLVGLNPIEITVEIGQCCDLSSVPFACLGDTFTRSDCDSVGGFYSMDKTCADECCCLTDDVCGDGDACTIDRCEIETCCTNTPVALADNECCEPATIHGSTADIRGLGAIASNDDGNSCTENLCDSMGVPFNPSQVGLSCDDYKTCTYADTCDDLGECLGSDVNAATCNTEADCEAVTGAAFPCIAGLCVCVEEPLCQALATGSANTDNGTCYFAGEKIIINMQVRASAGVLAGGQFNLSWDPSCVSFNGISTVSPYTTVLAQEVDAAGGTLFWAVGVGFDETSGDPLAGLPGNASFGSISFTKVAGCGSCDICMEAGTNPGDTIMADDTGQAIFCDLSSSCTTVQMNDAITLTVPDDQKINVDCNSTVANVDVGSASASSSCGAVDLDCNSPVGPAETLIGTNTYCCTATSVSCGGSVTDCWTVTVNDRQALDLEVQLSPIIAADDLDRCIEFVLIADCVTGSGTDLPFSMPLHFGGAGDFIGHFTDSIKTSEAGQWICITAQDQSHTLRSAATLNCVDGRYSATFKHDPFFGGNWLVGGNLDAWRKENSTGSNVIDIVDFGHFIWMWGQVGGTNNDCSEAAGPNGDIDGNGVVDLGDFNFIAQNFLSSSKDACCGSGVAAAPLARTEISVRELRQMGLGELAVADLNNDGMVDMTDLEAFMSGGMPTKKAPRGSKGSNLRSSR